MILSRKHSGKRARNLENAIWWWLPAVQDLG
jgi:hypothetical protein